jgi:hypothetical protein
LGSKAGTGTAPSNIERRDVQAMSDAQTMTTQPYLPADGREFLEYMPRVVSEMARLQNEGRVPDDEGVAGMLTFWRRATAQVRMDVSKAGASAAPITTSLPMSEGEYQRIWAMFDTVYPLLEILEMRGVVDMRRSEGVSRVVDALYQATLS